MQPLAEALACRNHNVTIFSEAPTWQPKLVADDGKVHEFLVNLREGGKNDSCGEL